MRLLIALGVSLAIPVCGMRKPGDEIKPGYNSFSRQQDIQLGQQAAAQVRSRFRAVPSGELQDYIRRIGERLASQKEARESGFAFTFTLLDDKSVNAFALPGGPAFVFTGLIVAADNEAQIAGVLGHEISHVILRHATHQMSKAKLLKIPGEVAGAVTGNPGLQQLTNMGAASLLLKFSRTDESEADALGARLMNEAGYDPIEMARFFEKLQAEGESRAPQFLSDHPDPGNRVNAVEAETLPLPKTQSQAAVGDFAAEKLLVVQLAQMRSQPNLLSTSSAAFPAAISAPGFKRLNNRAFSLSYPDDWEVHSDSNSITIAPREGMVQGEHGAAVGYGTFVSYYSPPSRTRDAQMATAELIQRLYAMNPKMRIVSGDWRPINIAGSPGLMTTMANDSPYQGQTETDVLLTVGRPQGLFYILFMAPESRYQKLKETLDEMVRSIRFSN